MNNVMRIYSIVLVLVIAGCGNTMPVRNYMDNQIMYQGQGTVTIDDVEKVIHRAAMSLGWKTAKAETGKITATLDVRTHQLVIDITYNEKSFSIEYISSINMKYTGTEIHKKYSNWVRNLIKEININIAT